jgi:lipid-A-disaccharide synthase-like uncharacterized protein
MSYGDALTVAYTNLTAGNYHTAVRVAMEGRFGDYFYLFLFGVPWFMVWLHTDDISLSTVLALWTIALYGAFMPGGFASEYMTLIFVVGAAILMFRLLSPAKAGG